MDSETKKPNISYFFPAFNDAGTVAALTEAGLAVLSRVADKYEIIIVNDGSFDDTGAVADAVAAQHPDTVKAVHHLYNIGYGAALKTGFKTAQYEWIFYTDGDMQYHPDELEKLLAEREAGVTIVSGYREQRADGWRRSFSSWLFNKTSRFLFGLTVRDIDSACKLIHRSVLDQVPLSINGDFICAEIFLRAKKVGLRWKQVPIKHHKRTYGSSSAIQIFFVLRAIIELLELWWMERGREGFYKFRQKVLRGGR